MNITDITEGATQIFSRQGGKLVRKYRCNSGQKKGRIVAKAQTCSTPVNVASKQALKKTKAKKSPLIKIKSRFTKRTNPSSKLVSKLNKTRMKPTKRSTKRRRMK